MKQVKVILLICFMLAPCSLAISAKTTSQDDEKTHGLSMRLISDHSAIQAGRPFMLGIHIQHEKGFHSYWKNPIQPDNNDFFRKPELTCYGAV